MLHYWITKSKTKRSKNWGYLWCWWKLRNWGWSWYWRYIAKKSNSYIVNIISQELRFEKKVNFYQPFQFNHTRRKQDDETDEPSDETDTTDGGQTDTSDGGQTDTSDGWKTDTSDGGKTDTTDGGKTDDDDGGLTGASLALAITLPIAGIIIIALIVFIIWSRKGPSNVDIEKMENLTNAK